jgi:hypothetical protein
MKSAGVQVDLYSPKIAKSIRGKLSKIAASSRGPIANIDPNDH